MSDLFRSVLGGGTGTSDPLIGSTVEAGQYRLLVKNKIAEGGFACIYRAVNEQNNDTVAIKRLLSNDKERRQDAIREASLMSKVKHKHIVQFITAAHMGGNTAGYEELLVVMEWCPSGLNDLLRDRGGFLNRFETTKVFYQSCSAIGVLHKMTPPCAHRDIKAENILIAANGVVKLCDFGSVTTQTFTPDDTWNHAQRTKIEEDAQRATTPAYRAPEICDLYSNYPIDERQDMWALGCLLVLLTTGRHPFLLGEKLAIINGRFSLSTNPEHTPFSSVVKQLLVLDPRKRCQSIPDLMDAIRAIAESIGGINPSDGIYPVPRKESIPSIPGSPETNDSNSAPLNAVQNSDIAAQASNMLGKATKIGSGLFSKLKSGINEIADNTLSYAEQKGWDHTLRSNVGITLPRSGPKHSQAPQDVTKVSQEYQDFNNFEIDAEPAKSVTPERPPERKNSLETPRNIELNSNGGNFFDTLDWDNSFPAPSKVDSDPSPAPVNKMPTPVVTNNPPVADLLGGSGVRHAPVNVNNSDPFAQWVQADTSSESANNNFDAFDPFGNSPQPKSNNSGPNLMGDWNASNILSNQGRPNFSNMQQPQKQKVHDPFMDLTSLGNNLQTSKGLQSQDRAKVQNQIPSGISPTGAWGATFQTRPQLQGQGGGWNAGAFLQTDPKQYQQAQARATAPPQPVKKGNAFDNLLDGFGSNFGSKTDARNVKMGDLKKQTDNKYRDPIDVKVEDWSKGRESNVRGLLASLHEVLWDNNNWRAISVGELLQPPAVKKAYRRACLVVHPDKHAGGPHEKLARAIFMQLSESYTKFEHNPTM